MSSGVRPGPPFKDVERETDMDQQEFETLHGGGAPAEAPVEALVQDVVDTAPTPGIIEE